MPRLVMTYGATARSAIPEPTTRRIVTARPIGIVRGDGLDAIIVRLFGPADLVPAHQTPALRLLPNEGPACLIADTLDKALAPFIAAMVRLLEQDLTGGGT